VAGVVAVTITGGISTLPPPLALLTIFGLSFAFSPICSGKLGFIMAIIVALLFIEPQGWLIAIIAWAIFLLGYFRLPLYPPALLGIAIFGGNNKGIHRRMRWLPPFSDEIFWLPLYGLDDLLINAVQQNDKQGQAAITHVDHVFRQEWAAQIAQIYLSAEAMSQYRTIYEISDALDELDWLPDKPPAWLESVVKVEQIIKKIVQYLESANKTSNELKRLAVIEKAYSKIKIWQNFSATLPDGDPALYFEVVRKKWSVLIRKKLPAQKKKPLQRLSMKD